MYWEYSNKKVSRRALQQGDWKIVQVNLNKPSSQIELYNLSTDIGETKDLSKSNPEKFSELLKLMDGARVASPLFPNKILD